MHYGLLAVLGLSNSPHAPGFFEFLKTVIKFLFRRISCSCFSHGRVENFVTFPLGLYQVFLLLIHFPSSLGLFSIVCACLHRIFSDHLQQPLSLETVTASSPRTLFLNQSSFSFSPLDMHPGQVFLFTKSSRRGPFPLSKTRASNDSFPPTFQTLSFSTHPKTSTSLGVSPPGH